MIDDFPHGHPEMDHTDDEREALARAVLEASVHPLTPRRGPAGTEYDFADRLVASPSWPFRRTEVPTDDEREALVLDLKVVAGIMKFLGYKGHADTVLRAVEALHRTARGEPSEALLSEIEQRVYDENKGQIAGMAKALVRAGWDAAAGFRRTEVPAPSGAQELTPCGNLVCTGCRVCGCAALGIEPQGEPSDALPIWERSEAIEAARLAYQGAYEEGYDAEDCIAFTLRAAAAAAAAAGVVAQEGEQR